MWKCQNCPKHPKLSSKYFHFDLFELFKILGWCHWYKIPPYPMCPMKQWKLCWFCISPKRLKCGIRRRQSTPFGTWVPKSFLVWAKNWFNIWLSITRTCWNGCEKSWSVGISFWRSIRIMPMLAVKSLFADKRISSWKSCFLCTCGA